MAEQLVWFRFYTDFTACLGYCIMLCSRSSSSFVEYGWLCKWLRSVLCFLLLLDLRFLLDVFDVV